jgi:amidase
MSATCDAQISEVVDDNVTIRIRVPKFDNRVRTL